jgi:hypothetical protein
MMKVRVRESTTEISTFIAGLGQAENFRVDFWHDLKMFAAKEKIFPSSRTEIAILTVVL